jgi:hypothetical protein
MSYDIPYEQWAFNDKPPKGPWRGTRSCPRDGTIFLVWRDADQRVRNASISENGKWHLWPNYGGEVYKADALPDYWMPWPESPDAYAKMAQA